MAIAVYGRRGNIDASAGAPASDTSPRPAVVETRFDSSLSSE